MEGLSPFPNITRLSKTVTRVMGQNPGNFTLQGTNTYLVGERNPYVLIDTGDGREEYIPVLEEALQKTTNERVSDKPHISDIILSHRHHDHCNGLPSVLNLLRRLWDDSHPSGSAAYTPPRVHKIPLSTPDTNFQSVLNSLSPESYTPSPSGNAIHDLADTDNLPVTASEPSDGHVLRILHTPGHTPDSLCIYYPADRALFTADTVLGHGSSVFEDLGPYMGSLKKMIEFGKDGDKYGLVYPGHGPVVTDGLQHVTMYLQHRVERENQIIDVLKKPSPPDGGWTTWSIVSTIYARYPKNLWEPAAHSTDLHLRKLEKDGRVEWVGGLGKDSQWELIN